MGMHMGRNRSIPFVALTIFLVLSAGCLQGAGSMTDGSTGASNQSWSGSWVTKIRDGEPDTPMDLLQQGVAVTGSFGYSDGTISGIATADRLTGTWSEKNGQATGPFTFVLADNGLSFTGWWAYSGDNFDDIRAGPPNWWGRRA